jgi:hypothetical protein
MTTGQLDQAVGFRATAGQVKRVVRLNIGLNGSPFSADEIKAILSDEIEIDSSFVHVSEWQGQEEPTLVVVGLTTGNEWSFSYDVKNLCDLFNQDAIAFKIGGKGVLQYRSGFTGTKDEFNEEFFI